MINSDTTLSYLAHSIINRRLPKILVQNTPFNHQEITKAKEEAKKRMNLDDSVLGYYVFSGSVHNNAYSEKQESINMLQKNGSVINFAEASDNYKFPMLQHEVEKFYLCYPK